VTPGVSRNILNVWSTSSWVENVIVVVVHAGKIIRRAPRVHRPSLRWHSTLAGLLPPFSDGKRIYERGVALRVQFIPKLTFILRRAPVVRPPPPESHHRRGFMKRQPARAKNCESGEN